MTAQVGRTRVLAGAAALALLAVAVAHGTTGAAGSREPGKEKPRKERRPPQLRPNVIVVMTDDQNDSLEAMPGVERLLGNQGTTFTRAFVSVPFCCPSRATFITGQYAHNHGVLRNDPLEGGGLQALQAQRNTLPVWLRRAGYRTAHIGKYLNGYGRYQPYRVPPGWERWFTLAEYRKGVPLPGGEQFRYGFTANADGRLSTWPRRPSAYVTDVLRRKALKLVRGWAPSPQPFFLWFTPNNPHGEPSPPGYTRNPRPAPRHTGTYESVELPRQPNLNEADVSDKPETIRNRPLLTEEEISDLELRYRSRMESLVSVDEALAALVRRLKRARDLDDTVIVFTSDNAILLGEHRLVFKGFLYEEAINVPLLIRGPGFPRGARRSQPVSNVDLAPTLMEIAGAKGRHRRFDGRSLLRFVREKRFGRRRTVLLEAPDGAVGVRTPFFVYLRRPSGEIELYDLTKDPYQLQSRHGDPAYAATSRRLAARLAALRDCAAAGCRRNDGAR